MDNNNYTDLVRNLLLKEWDPIGISWVPSAQDEYDNYIDAVLNILNADKGVEELFTYLWYVETKYMSLGESELKTKRAAENIYKNFKESTKTK